MTFHPHQQTPDRNKAHKKASSSNLLVGMFLKNCGIQGIFLKWLVKIHLSDC